MKVMTFNVCFGGGDRMEAIEAVLRRERPDLCVLEECLGWDEGDRLARAAAALDVPHVPAHVHLGRARPRGSGNRYHVAVLSRTPLVEVREHADPAFQGHCLVEATTVLGGAPLTVFGTHLDAHHESLRFVEVRWLRTRAPPERLAREACLLAGDLNSLSRADPYPPDLAARLAEAHIDKYGHPPRFEVMDDLFAAGWIDTLAGRPAGAPWITARRQNDGVAIDFRTDYVLVSPPLAPRLRAARVVDVGEASDHHAVVAELS